MNVHGRGVPVVRWQVTILEVVRPFQASALAFAPNIWG